MERLSYNKHEKQGDTTERQHAIRAQKGEKAEESSVSGSKGRHSPWSTTHSALTLRRKRRNGYGVQYETTTTVHRVVRLPEQPASLVFLSCQAHVAAAVCWGPTHSLTDSPLHHPIMATSSLPITLITNPNINHVRYPPPLLHYKRERMPSY